MSSAPVRPAADRLAGWRHGHRVLAGVLSTGLAVPVDRPARRPDGRAHHDVGLPRSGAARRHRLPRPVDLDRSRRVRRPAVRPRRRDGRRADRRARRERHRLGLPAQLLRAGAGRVPRPRQREDAAAQRSSLRLGRPGGVVVPPRARHPRLRARQGLGARHRARRRRDRHPGAVAPLRDQRADRLPRRARRPAADDRLRPAGGRRDRPDGRRDDADPASQRGQPQGARAVDLPDRRRRQPVRQQRRARPLPAGRQRAGLPALAARAAHAREQPARRAPRPDPGAGRGAEGRPTSRSCPLPNSPS